jgi:hypothetical protein
MGKFSSRSWEAHLDRLTASLIPFIFKSPFTTRDNPLSSIPSKAWAEVKPARREGKVVPRSKTRFTSLASHRISAESLAQVYG